MTCVGASGREQLSELLKRPSRPAYLLGRLLVVHLAAKLPRASAAARLDTEGKSEQKKSRRKLDSDSRQAKPSAPFVVFDQSDRRTSQSHPNINKNEGALGLALQKALRADGTGKKTQLPKTRRVRSSTPKRGVSFDVEDVKKLIADGLERNCYSMTIRVSVRMTILEQDTC